MLKLTIPPSNTLETVTARIRTNNEWPSREIKCVKVITVEQYGLFGPYLVTDAEWKLTEITPLAKVKLYHCPHPHMWQQQGTQRTVYDINETDETLREQLYPRRRLLPVPPTVTKMILNEVWAAITSDPLYRHYSQEIEKAQRQGIVCLAQYEYTVSCATILLTGHSSKN